MNLRQTLEQIMKDFGLPNYEGSYPKHNIQRPFPNWASDDPHDGWDAGQGSWHVGSIWGVEGKVLYSLIRYARPGTVLEIGTAEGCSATHIAQALYDNKKGKLTCIDHGTNAGGRIPDELRKRITFKFQDAYENLAQQTAVDFIFEDGAHGADYVEKVVRMAVEKLTPGGWLVSHDAAHFLAGENVMRGYANAGITPKVYLIEPADCGLAIWRKPLDAPAPAKPKAKAAPKKRGRPRKTAPKVPAVEDFKAHEKQRDGQETGVTETNG